MSVLTETVYLVEAAPAYPDTPPYHPSEAYPEYPFRNLPGAVAAAPNHAYAAVREMLRLLGLDAARYGTAEWNPLGELARPGQTILLKPNWVTDRIHGVTEGAERILDCLITHPAVLRPLMDYAQIAVGPTGRIVLADAAIQNTDFDLLLQRSHIPELRAFFREQSRTQVEVHDLRLNGTLFADDGRVIKQMQLSGDPLGYTRVNLGAKSMLAALDKTAKLYRSMNYDEGETLSTHSNGKHEYLIAKSVLAADCVINVPKLKTHIKAGVTAALKNLVGINGNKAFLPHYRLGAPADRGDEYPVQNWLLRMKSQYRYRLSLYPAFVREPIRRTGNFFLNLSLRNRDDGEIGGADPYLVTGGSWHGNDTTWRMVIDLNKILRYADKEGKLHATPQRRVLSVVDALVAGEGNGPLSPQPRPFGKLLAGFEPATIDVVSAHLIGFDWRKLGLLREGAPALCGRHDLDSVPVHLSNGAAVRLNELESADFLAPKGWRGFVELQAETRAG